MNQLYPTDLSNTNLDVRELDFPPPPINLPPNVSQDRMQHAQELTCCRPHSRLLQMPIAPQDMCGLHSIRSRRPILSSRSLDFLLPWSYNPMDHCTTTKIPCLLCLIRSLPGVGGVGPTSTLSLHF